MMEPGFDYALLAGAETLCPATTVTSDDSLQVKDGARMRRAWSGASTATVSSSSASPSSASDEEEGVLTDFDGAVSSSDESSSSNRKHASEKGLASENQWLPRKVPSQDPNDWLWMHTEEPHRSRRRAILKAHPEVTKLMGHEPLTKYVVILVVAIQFAAAFMLRNTHPLSWQFLLTAYAVGGTANQNLFLAIHEITHNLAFKGIRSNRLFAIFANLPIGIPYAMMFKKYHMEHHRALGVDGVDTDLPTRAELLVLRNVAGKAFFCTFQILFYALRPGFVRSQKLTVWHALNASVQLGFDALVYYIGSSFLQLAHPSYPIWYFILSSFFAGSLHPCAGHFIAEHYLFEQWDQETWSYYGPLNALTYNVGYHNEHHDFPSIPWTRLPALNRLANEFYADLPSHSSWVAVTYKFIFRADVGLFSRVKRHPAVPASSSLSPSSTTLPPGAGVLENADTAGGSGDLGGLKDE